MDTSETRQTLPEISAQSSKAFWWCFAFLFFVVVLFHGKPVPFSNEQLYLLRLEPHFLPNDWTFSSPADEHWLFNFLFGFPARILSLEVIGWLGRIAVWIFCLIPLIKLGRRWKIPHWAISVSIVLWLAFGQAVVNGEWIFGGFEAKTVAYVCLLFALDEFSRRKIILPSVLLGLSFSFHPAVGVWAIPAIGLALLFEKIPMADFAKVVVLTGIFSLPGLIPLLGEQGISGAANSFDDWRFIVVYRVPIHLDLFQFSRSGTLLIFVMLAFNFFALRKSEHFALRLLLKFQFALAAFFLLGMLLRWLEMFPLLRFMPMRLFPVLTPVFFLFTAFRFVPKLATRNQKIAAALFVAAIVAVLNPFRIGFGQIRQTVQMQSDAPEDFEKTSRWLAANTPADATIIQPPNRREFWYWSNRAAVVSFAYPTYDRLGEWRARLADLTGNLRITKGDGANEEIESAFDRLPEAEIERLKTKYAATYLVSRAVYSYPIIFETETYKIYQLE